MILWYLNVFDLHVIVCMTHFADQINVKCAIHHTHTIMHNDSDNAALHNVCHIPCIVVISLV